MNKIITVTEPSRDHDWVSESQIKKFLPKFYDKVKEVRKDNNYSVHTQNLVKSIAEYLDIHEIISWKQFDAVMNCSKPSTRLVSRPIGVTKYSAGLANVGLKAIKRHLNELHWDVAFDEESISIGDLIK